MEIKKNLKSYDIKISKMANELGVSRPTLDAYIEAFENGQQISNENYQKIFEYLFSTECKSSIEFAQRYDYVKRVMLNDAKTSIRDIKLSDREEELKTKVISNVTNNQVNKNLLEFINLFINNSDNELVKAIYTYFAYANGIESIKVEELLYKDKALYSLLAKSFSEYQKDTIELNEEYFNSLVEKNKRLFEKKQPKVENEDIINYIKANVSDSSNIDFDKLKELLESRKD